MADISVSEEAQAEDYGTVVVLTSHRLILWFLQKYTQSFLIEKNLSLKGACQKQAQKLTEHCTSDKATRLIQEQFHTQSLSD